jgi:hypothetical protein
MKYFEKIADTVDHIYMDTNVQKEYDKPTINRKAFKDAYLKSISNLTTKREAELAAHNLRAGKKQTNAQFAKNIAANAIGGGAAGYLAGGVVKALTKKKIPAFTLGVVGGTIGFGAARAAKGKSTHEFKDPKKDWFLSDLENEKKHINLVVDNTIKSKFW